MNRFLKIFLPALVASVILYFCFPRSGKFPYEYRQGAHWQYETLYADFDFPLLKSDARMQEEILEKSTVIIPYYRYSSDVVDASEKRLAEIYLGPYDYLRPELEKSIGEIYQIGVFPEEGAKLEKGQNPDGALVYIQKGKRVSTFPASEIYNLSMARRQLLFLLERTCPEAGLDSVLQASFAYELIAPNLLYDEQTTALMNSSDGEAVSPTFGYEKSGSLIVSKGQIITPEIKQKLDSYRAEFDSTFAYSRNGILFVIANLLLAVILVVLLLAIIYFCDARILFLQNKYLYILMIFLLLSMSSLMVIRFWEEKYLYMMPFTLGALLLVTFIDRKVALPVYTCSLLPLLFFSHSGIVVYFVFTCGGAATVFFFKRMHRGWRQFLLALIVFAVMFACYCSMRLLDFALGESWKTVIFLLVASMLCVALYPLIYLFERIFSLVSDSRLAELADTSHPLLRELERKAPGTFQHSLQVANM
ncbi:MAG: hypothetical protein IJU69_04925, partial [Bacteroidales bacterium]|nr:hypothetical protein [Bacteroidales bacterium]